MKNSRMLYSTILTLLLFSLCSVATATQVVTPQDNEWARAAIQQEDKLASPPQENTIAVLYFSNQTQKAKLNPLQKGLALMLTTDLAKISDLQVLERVKLQALLDELDLGKTALVAAETTPRIGKLLAVRHLVGGNFSQKQPDNFAINSDLFQIPSGEIFSRAEAKGLFKDIFNLEKTILFKIIAALDTVTVTEKEQIELRKPLTNNADALFAFMAGIEHSDNGEYAEAHDAYKEAVKIDPGFVVAKKAKLELEGLGLSTPKQSRNLGKSLRRKVSLGGALAGEDLRNERNPAEVSDSYSEYIESQPYYP
jgi:TolB-like protein